MYDRLAVQPNHAASRVVLAHDNGSATVKDGKPAVAIVSIFQHLTTTFHARQMPVSVVGIVKLLAAASPNLNDAVLLVIMESQLIAGWRVRKQQVAMGI